MILIVLADKDFTEPSIKINLMKQIIVLIASIQQCKSAQKFGQFFCAVTSKIQPSLFFS